MDDIRELLHYHITSITRNKTSRAEFGRPQSLIDEGSFFRLAELHIIPKNNLLCVKIEGDEGTLLYKNGDVIVLGLLEK